MIRTFLRTIGETVTLVFQELRNNKLRTFLSLLGVTIGIFCIIAVLSAVDSLKQNLESGISKLGSNMLYIQKWPWAFGDEEYPWWEYIKRPSPDYDEYRMLREKVPDAQSICITAYFNSNELRYADHTVKNADVVAVSEDYESVFGTNFESGRFFSSLESAAGDPLAVLGKNVADQLFPPNIDPVGKFIWVLGNKVRVIGVIEKEGQSLIDFSDDNNVLLPYNYIRRIMDMKSPTVDPLISVKPYRNISVSQMKGEIIPAMRNARHLSPLEDDNFAVNEVTLIDDAFKKTFGVMDLVGWIIGIFAIIVGGFGIANIMFVSVKERTNIIGIKKSLGAKNYLILTEFLIEAIILALIGCLLGLLLVWLLILLANTFSAFQFILSLRNFMIGISISTGLGVLAGIIPAIAASRLDPVVAIRSK